MEDRYIYEPSKMEILSAGLIGNTLVKPYYHRMVKKLGLMEDDKVLDYCSGSGIISKMISKQLRRGRLIYADVSEKWLVYAEGKLKHCKNAKGEKIQQFHGKISGGEYDKVLLHFSLHDFPPEYRLQIINQLVVNLKPAGKLFIREPLSITHGIELHELINLLEHTKKLSYEYEIIRDRFIGEYADIAGSLNISEIK